MTPQETAHYQLLKVLEKNPAISQRELAQELGVSLGKANYCLKALLDKGYVKAENFRRNDNKLGYLYLLTPSGIEEKARVTARFLRRKVAEYDALREEIEQLQRTIAEDPDALRLYEEQT